MTFAEKGRRVTNRGVVLLRPLSPSLPVVAVYNSSTLLLPRLGCRRVEELQEGGREGGGVARGLLWSQISQICEPTLEVFRTRRGEGERKSYKSLDVI